MATTTKSMFAKYLRKDHGFWKIQSGGNQTCLCKHSSKYGGIYAYIEPGMGGVRIVTNGFSHFFNDFNKLGEFLARLEETAERNHNGLVQALYRTASARMMRTYAL